MSGKSGFFSAQVDEKAAGFWLDLEGGNYVPVLGDFLKTRVIIQLLFDSSSAWSSGHSCSVRAHWGGGIEAGIEAFAKQFEVSRVESSLEAQAGTGKRC
jgi:hypothetical protein